MNCSSGGLSAKRRPIRKAMGGTRLKTSSTHIAFIVCDEPMTALIAAMIDSTKMIVAISSRFACLLAGRLCAGKRNGSPGSFISISLLLQQSGNEWPLLIKELIEPFYEGVFTHGRGDHMLHIVKLDVRVRNVHRLQLPVECSYRRVPSANIINANDNCAVPL